MRKIEKEVIGAFIDGKAKTMGNTAPAAQPAAQPEPAPQVQTSNWSA